MHENKKLALRSADTTTLMYLYFMNLKASMKIRLAMAINGMTNMRYGVNVPNSTPLSSEEIEGMKINGNNFLGSNFETENIKSKFIMLPITN